jgi:hypothetical protein
VDGGGGGVGGGGDDDDDMIYYTRSVTYQLHRYSYKNCRNTIDMLLQTERFSSLKNSHFLKETDDEI